MNEFSTEQPQSARQVSSSCAESHAAQREESGLSIEPTPAESRQSTMPTDATDRLAIGEIGADATTGQHTNEQAGSHDCELVVVPTGQGITASLEARAGRTLLPAESNFVQNMTTDSNPALTPSDEEVQKPASAPSVQPQSSNGCTPEVASGSPVSTLSNTSENKSEGVNLPAAAEGEPSAEAESGSSTATNSTQTKAMNANQTNPVSSGHAEEDAQGNSCEQTVQPSVEINACAASPGENEQIANPQAEPPSSVSTDSINPDAAAEAPASAEADNNNSNTITTMSTNNDTPANGSVSDVNAADVTNITPENAAALASANLNSGTDCATTSDTTMNKTYTTKCSVVRHNKPSFNVIAPMSDEPQMITLSYSKGHPSSSSDVHPSINRRCYHDGNTIVSASGSVDDSVSISAPGLDYTSSSGATHSFGATGTSVPAGYYDVSVTHSNIQSHPAGNVSVLTGSVGPFTFRTIIPDENEEIECDSCTCDAQSNTDGGSQPGNARAVENITIVPFTSSSGGSGVVRTANARHMRFAFAFGSFRGMGNVPGGQPEIVAFNYDASLLTPAALTYKHPLASVLVPEGDSVDANEGFRIFDGAAYANYIVSGDGSKAFAVGATSKKSEVVRFVSAISKDDSVVCNLSDASYVRVSSADDSAVFYYLNGENKNEFAAYISPDGATIEADEKLSIIRDTETGIIRQIWNYWDGLADVVPATEGNGYTISLYLPSQLTAPVEDGQLFTFAGDPFKTFTISGDAETQSMTIRERDWSLPENTPDYVTTWTHSEAGWNKVIGEEDDVISETRVKSAIEDSDDYQIVTTVSKGGVVASCVCEVFTSSVNGELCISRTEAYGSDIAQTTTFEYDEAGREVKRVTHHGGVYETVYDKYGRVTVESSPWAGGQKQLTSTIYREVNSYNSDPAKVVQSVVSSSGGITDLRTDTYTYTETDGVRRVEINSTAAGSSFTQNKVEETWLSTAENVYARGRVKMHQEVNGVQTHYEYTATTEHNALYSVTSETRVNGVVVAGQSRRTVEFISAEGNSLRKEEYALLSDGETWALLSGVTNTYDAKNRLVGTLKDNGRTTSKVWNCSGLILSEVDEDGITTTYSYNTARQLVETIRSEISILIDNETNNRKVITPETITSYTRDAMGHILCTRKDVGAMTSIEYKTYDLLGRITSQTDPMGRLTVYSYSIDGLTETVTSSSGASTITVYNADKSISSITGTGQRETYYEYDLNGGCTRTTEKAAMNTIIAQTIKNGFGETIVEMQAATNNRAIYTRSEYNNKGLLIKRYQDNGWNTASTAPMLYEYNDFGKVCRETLALSDDANPTNSLVAEFSENTLLIGNEVYCENVHSRYNADGSKQSCSQKILISSLSSTLEADEIVLNERSIETRSWSTYGEGPIRYKFLKKEECTNTSEMTIVDNFAISSRDEKGGLLLFTRNYTETGSSVLIKDGHGNNHTKIFDILDRLISEVDSSGRQLLSISYDSDFNQPSHIVDIQGNDVYYKYDNRGRKIAEWGTGTQPICYSYDDSNRLISETTFRHRDNIIISDPTLLTDGDVTSWVYDYATGLELSKIFADGTLLNKSYDAYNRISSETNAQGKVKTYSYEHERGLLISVVYSDSEIPETYEYNHLGQLIKIVDMSGTRILEYNQYGEISNESTLVNEVTHTVTECRDDYGRSTGYIYSKDGINQQVVSFSYDEYGRVSTTAFLHNDTEKSFTYNYLEGSNLVSSLTMPCNMTLMQTFDSFANRLTDMSYHRASTLVVQRTYDYDEAGRLTARITKRNGQTTHDVFSYNNRSELTTATVSGINYSYDYDNAFNRKYHSENEQNVSCDSNSVNQYLVLGDFEPTYDADGNQTLIKTSTGIWNVSYNCNNQPIRFTKQDDSIVIEYIYDNLGRKVEKKVITGQIVTSRLRYIYKNNHLIACCDMMRSGHPSLWLITWEAGDIVQSRPLAIQKDGTWYAYGWDLTKNICEIFGQHGYIRTTYKYSPYGNVESAGDVEQPLLWGSELYEENLGLHAYLFRHYNPTSGSWISRDPAEDCSNLYNYCNNAPNISFDALGLLCVQAQDPSTRRVLNVNAGPALLSLDYGFSRNTEYCCKKCPSGSNGISVSSEIALSFGVMAEMASYMLYLKLGVSYGVFTASIEGKFWAGLRVYGKISAELFLGVEFSTCQNKEIEINKGFRVVGSFGFEGGFDGYVKGTIGISKWYLGFIKKSVTFGFGASVGGRIEIDWRPTLSCSLASCRVSGPATLKLVGTARLRFTFANTEVSISRDIAKIPNLGFNIVPILPMIPYTLM